MSLLTENDLWRVVIPLVGEGLQGFENLRVERAFRPHMLPDPATPSVILQRAGSRRVGAQGKSRRHEPGDRLVELETWVMEDVFEARAFVHRDVGDEGYTARDVLAHLAAVLQSQPTIDALARKRMGILRINDFDEVPFEDENGEWRFSVSIKFVLTYRQTIERETPSVARFSHEIHRI